MLPPGPTPRLPEIAEPMSVRMSPNRFDATITSSVCGCVTMRAHSASTWYFVSSTSGNSFATSATTSSHSTIACCSAFDFVALASIFRGRVCASLNA